MATNIPGLIAVAVFYAIILAIGIWAARKSKQEEKKSTGTETEVTLVAGRKMNTILGIFTMTATWVGGGYILGIAAAVYNPTKGMVWGGVMPVQYLVNFLIAGIFFAEKMRAEKYVTMMDPFQLKYGKTMTCTLLIPALIADMLWIACIMATLGGTMGIILDIPAFYSIAASSAVAIIYTLFGGMYAVAYTDVIQLMFIFVSLWMCIPFLMLNPASTYITLTAFNGTLNTPWVGKLELTDLGLWIDDFLVLSLGGLASQILHQRILSAASSKVAQIMCYGAAGFSCILGIPSVLIGAVAASTDWNMTSYGSLSPYERGEAVKILPIALQYLTPNYISILGIGAVAAAVMSSVDSCLLASASLFTENIYKTMIRKKASDRELQWVIKLSVTVVGLVGLGLTFLGNSVLNFWILGTDVVYAIMLPQLVCVLYFPVSNIYGAVGGYIIAVMIRLLSGEPLLHLPPAIHFPGCKLVNGVYIQTFPYRSLAMITSFCAILLISYITSMLFEKGLLPERWDVGQSRIDCATTAGEEKDENIKSAVSDQLLDTTC
ncbi:hypothetical protein GJAV_G00095360 [Gymnothorax javanicus]|nr:hypothetical protein GJAV_G00095360 [Gymnothorax javanicus]